MIIHLIKLLQEMNYDYVGHMGNTSFGGILVFPVESWLQWESAESSLIPSISQSSESTVYRWPVLVKCESIGERTGLDGSVSPIAYHGRSTSKRYFYWARKELVPWSDWQFLPTPTHFYICRWWHIFMWLRNGWIKACLCSTRCHMWLKKSRMRLVSVCACPCAAV